MKKKSMFSRLMIPMASIVCLLAVVIVGCIILVFSGSCKEQVFEQLGNTSHYISEQVGSFTGMAFKLMEQMESQEAVKSMDTARQTPVLRQCTEKNAFFELLYIQGTDGMQTGRSSGELADRSNRWWFTQMMEKKEPFISKSYYSVNTNMPCSSIFLPIMEGERMKGIFAGDIKLDSLQDLVTRFSGDGGGSISFILDGEGVVTAHPDSRYLEELYNYKEFTKTVAETDGSGGVVYDKDGNLVTKEETIAVSEDFKEAIDRVMGGETGQGTITNEGVRYYISYCPVVLSGQSDSWSVITMQSVSDAMAPMYRMIKAALAAAALILILAISSIAVLSRKITKPVVSIAGMITAASEGDFTVRADETDRTELGVLAANFNHLVQKLAGILSDTSGVTGEVVEKGTQLDVITADMTALSGQMRRISEDACAQTGQTGRVFQLADEMKSRIRSLREESGRIQTQTQTAREAGILLNERIQELTGKSGETLTELDKTCEAVFSLNEKAGKIKTVVETISGIAKQTGILSINASVEAARAGEQGRGFSVVAMEIKKLADGAEASAKDIGRILRDVAQEVEAASGTVEGIRESFAEQEAFISSAQNAFAELYTCTGEMTEKTRQMGAWIEAVYEKSGEVVEAAGIISDIAGRSKQSSLSAAASLEERRELLRSFAEEIKKLSDVSARLKTNLSRFRI